MWRQALNAHGDGECLDDREGALFDTILELVLRLLPPAVPALAAALGAAPTAAAVVARLEAGAREPTLRDVWELLPRALALIEGAVEDPARLAKVVRASFVWEVLLATPGGADADDATDLVRRASGAACSPSRYLEARKKGVRRNAAPVSMLRSLTGARVAARASAGEADADDEGLRLARLAAAPGAAAGPPGRANNEGAIGNRPFSLRVCAY